jgi:hypothetical protein
MARDVEGPELTRPPARPLCPALLLSHAFNHQWTQTVVPIKRYYEAEFSDERWQVSFPSLLLQLVPASPYLRESSRSSGPMLPFPPRYLYYNSLTSVAFSASLFVWQTATSSFFAAVKEAALDATGFFSRANTDLDRIRARYQVRRNFTPLPPSRAFRLPGFLFHEGLIRLIFLSSPQHPLLPCPPLGLTSFLGLPCLTFFSDASRKAQYPQLGQDTALLTSATSSLSQISSQRSPSSRLTAQRAR